MPEKRSNADLAKTMSMTVDDYAKSLPRPKVQTWAERRAAYVPNTDAGSLGFGSRHRHYQRYLSTFTPGTASAVRETYQDQTQKEYAVTENTSPDVTLPPCGRTLSRPGSRQGAVPLYTDAHKGNYIPDAATRRLNTRHSFQMNAKLQEKQTQYDDRGKPVLVPAGLGYGYPHRDHATYTAAKQPRDVVPYRGKLNYNAWM